MKQIIIPFLIILSFFSCKKSKIITYPENGAYGINILNKGNTDFSSEEYSLAANLGRRANLKIKIISTSNGIWFYAVGSENNWTISSYNGTQTFTSVNKGDKCDLYFLLHSGAYLIEYYENEDSSPTYTKSIIKS